MIHHREHAPSGYRPEDVAEIRDWLVADLTDGRTGDTLDRYERFCQEVLKRPAPTSRVVELAGLEHAKLFWVPPDESKILGEARTDLPDDLTLEPDFMPCPVGFVVFAHPFFGIDSMTGEKMFVPLRALRWGPVSLPTEYDNIGRGAVGSDIVMGVALSAYTYLSEARGSRESLESFVNFYYGGVENSGVSSEQRQQSTDQLVEEALTAHGSNVWSPLGRSDWEFFQNWKDHRFFTDENNADKVDRESVIEDRRLAAALWALMGSCQPVEQVPSRAQRRRAERTGREAPPVRIVTWRGPQGQTVATDAPVSGRHVGVRYYVKPFWRWQRHGPGNTKRKYILIPPHWRGPQDAPLSNPHETINKIVGRK